MADELLIKIRTQNAKRSADELGQVAGATDKVGGAAAKAAPKLDAQAKSSTRVGTAAQGAKTHVKALAAAMIGAGLIKGVTTVTGAASDLNEEVSKTGVVFKQEGGAMIQWSKGSAQGFGQSQQQALAAANTFGNMLVPMGTSREQAAEMSRAMVELGGDMASFNNADPTETLDALRAGLAGESEPLRRFGVFLNDARLKEEAMRLGLYKGKGQLDANAKAQATYSLILKDSKDAQGDFARTSDGLANKQRILKAELTDLAAKVGQFLLPVMTGLVSIALGIITGLGKIRDGIVFLLPGIGALTAVLVVLNAQMIAQNIAFGLWAIRYGVVTGATWALTAAQGALNAVMMLNPITLIIALIAGLVVAIVLLWKRSETLRNILTGVWNGIKNAAGSAINWVGDKIGWLVNQFKALPGKISSAVSGAFNGIKNAFRDAINWIINKWNSFELSIGPIKIPAAPDIPKVSVNTPNIPLLAEGGVMRGNADWISGEAGPERVSVRNGTTTVTPLAQSSETGGGGLGGTVVRIVARDGALQDLLESLIEHVEVKAARA